MQHLVSELQNIIWSVQHNIPFVLFLVGILWLINLVNLILHYRLNILGIYPRTYHGLLGIFFTPFLHSNFGHLFFNSIPLFVLANLVLIQGYKTFYLVSIAIIILSGLAIWLFGKPGIHVGASALIMGYFGYLLANAYYQLTATTIILAILCLYYLSGLFFALIPTGEKGISWEGHVFGFLAGILVAYLSRGLIY